ncbi:MAG: hypothetical protein AAF993_17765, partial [Pseudomonadota bacterium]
MTQKQNDIRDAELSANSPHDIAVRKIPFDFASGVKPVWHPTQHEWSHMLNGASLTMPYLEPFLN